MCVCWAGRLGKSPQSLEYLLLFSLSGPHGKLLFHKNGFFIKNLRTHNIYLVTEFRVGVDFGLGFL